MPDALLLAKVLVSAFFAVLFLQSGLDKALDWSGNKSYINEHFSKSPLSGFSTLLLGIMTVAETLTGVLSGGSAVILLLGGNNLVPPLAMTAACVCLLMLFGGQRIAKDYAGAQGLASYFIVALFGLTLMWPGWLSLVQVSR